MNYNYNHTIVWLAYYALNNFDSAASWHVLQ